MVAIQRIQVDGWERARDVRLRALREAPDAFWTTADEEVATTADKWRERVSTSDSATFVAVRDGVDVGLAVGAPHHEHQGDAGLYALWVAPEARGTGVATALVEAVVGWARSVDYRWLRLDVADTNGNASRLYQRMGFQTTGAVSAFSSPRDHITEHERALDLRPADPPV